MKFTLTSSLSRPSYKTLQLILPTFDFLCNSFYAIGRVCMELLAGTFNTGILLEAYWYHTGSLLDPYWHLKTLEAYWNLTGSLLAHARNHYKQTLLEFTGSLLGPVRFQCEFSKVPVRIQGYQLC